MKRPARLALLAAATAMLVGQAAARTIEGTVVRVTDGDSLWLQPDAPGKKAIELRLAGIDAPEGCQPGGAEARQALAARVLKRRAQATSHAIDKHRRTVATLRVNGEDIGAWMVRQGHAWSFGYRHAPAPYARQEAEARAARRGVFADPRAQDPRQFRQQHGPCA